MMDGDLAPRHGTFLPEKISRRHRERLAMVYIRQSTVQQVERHQESTRLQYALVDRAFDFGWAREAIVVIDDDLGRRAQRSKGVLASSGSSRRSALAMSVWFWVWRCRALRGRAGIGINYWKSVRCSTR
jgi:hypothetical protein